MWPFSLFYCATLSLELGIAELGNENVMGCAAPFIPGREQSKLEGGGGSHDRLIGFNLSRCYLVKLMVKIWSRFLNLLQELMDPSS